MPDGERTFHLKLLGPPGVEGPDGIRVKGIPGLGFGLLAYLSLDAKRHSRENLASLLWPRSPLPKARHSLRQILTTMRKVLLGVLLSDEEFVRVDRSRLSVDVHAFEHEIRWSRPESALRHWRGPFMEGWGRGASWEMEEWVDGKRNRVHRLLRTSVAEGAKALLATGHPRDAAALVEVELEPEDVRLQNTLEHIEKWRVGGRSYGWKRIPDPIQDRGPSSDLPRASSEPRNREGGPGGCEAVLRERGVQAMIEYKGYRGVFEFDSSIDAFHGRVVGLQDVVTFEGRSLDKLRREMAESVEDYLQLCAEVGKDPERPFRGEFLVRTTPEVHRAAAVEAEASGGIVGIKSDTWS